MAARGEKRGAASLVSSHFLHGRHQFRNLDADYRALPGPALDIRMKIRSVQYAQPLSHVAQTNAFLVHMEHFFLGEPDTIDRNLYEKPPLVVGVPQCELAASQRRREPM